MKKLIYSLILIFTLGISGNTVLAAEKSKPEPTAAQLEQFQNIKTRVNQIRKMDKSNLTSEEKTAIRAELKEMKAQARGLDNKVTLSVGAIIIIILLLILIID